MTEEQKDRLNELIMNLVMAERDQIWETSRWDSSRSARLYAEEAVSIAAEELDIFIEGL